MTNPPNSADGLGPIQAPEVDFVALRPGQMIGRYEIVAVLGQGGFGITYRARDVQLGRDVAIKEFLPSALAFRQDGVTVLPRTTKLADDFGWGRERFVAEGQTLATLHRTPAIVHVFDFLEANGTAYIVMELLSGETLEERLKRTGKLDPEDIDRILWPLLDGLEQVHDAGFLHRDIKPANILLDSMGNPTLIDFGASRAAMAGRTAAMTAIFTPGYAAPEQFASARQGPWTDIYGVSATLYDAITGHPPPSAFERMLDDGYEPLTKLVPAGFSPGVLAGIDAGLALRANDRPQSIAGWYAILSQATAGADAAATVVLSRRPDPTATMISPRAATTTPELEPAPARRQAGLWIGAAAAVLVLVGGVYFFATSSPPTAPTSVAAAATNLNEAQKAEADQALRREIAEETRRQIEAERAEQKRLDDEVHQKAEADALANRQAEEEAKKRADAAQAAPAPAPTTRAAPPTATAANIAAAAPRLGPDGEWRGMMHCTPSRFGPEITISLHIAVSGGSGTWVRPGAGPGTLGNHSVSLTMNGAQVVVTRVFMPNNRPGSTTSATMTARLEGNAIIGAGPEANSGGRTCDIHLTRAP
jgi:serine/threonine protein kinase